MYTRKCLMTRLTQTTGVTSDYAKCTPLLPQDFRSKQALSSLSLSACPPYTFIGSSHTPHALPGASLSATRMFCSGRLLSTAWHMIQQQPRFEAQPSQAHTDQPLYSYLHPLTGRSATLTTRPLPSLQPACTCYRCALLKININNTKIPHCGANRTGDEIAAHCTSEDSDPCTITTGNGCPS